MPEPLEILKKYWGYQKFRPLQHEIINSVLSGKNTFVLLPTGGGKSLCYQVPSLCKEGITLVVSPLIALMKDQVQNLSQKGIKSLAVFSGLKNHEIDAALDNCIYGDYKFLYISPERLSTALFKERVKEMKVNLLAIDEAHCISQWGYDFRPAYLKIAAIKELLPPKTPIIALTASATSEVKKDIIEKLELNQPNYFAGSFERKNIIYALRNTEDKYGKIKEIAQKVKGSGIVYAGTRKRTVEVAKFLNSSGCKATFYHAGLVADERNKRQEQWMQGQIPIIVSTNAFGMGIDKPDVRWVVHYDLPESVEAYYQEAGRAGRDEKKSFAVLLTNEADKIALHKKILLFPSAEELKHIYHCLCNFFELATGAGALSSYPFDINRFTAQYRLSNHQTLLSIELLQNSGLIAASEAVFMPSRIKILIDRIDLYNFQLKNPDFDGLIKMLLRNMPGVNDFFVKCKEQELAHWLKIPEDEIINMLLYLHKINIIEYIQSTDKPIITFIENRLLPHEIFLDETFINWRKKTYENRLKAILEYANNNIKCRSKFILNYFDEVEKSCGVCDICIAQKKINLSEKNFIKIQSEIMLLLRSSALSFEELTLKLSLYSKEEISNILKWLTDNEVLKITENQKFEITVSIPPLNSNRSL